MYVIGTAGHVDHGKSSLVQALTGIDPDRLREEKEREMTIDLGFAWLTLDNGETVGIVDVPGHRDFIENMLAGVGGIDLALFVVAADEGVMPQTSEHLAILDLLEIRSGVVALTKTDLVEDPDWLDLVALDLQETLADSFLKDSPVVPVSSRTGEGLEALREAIQRALEDIEPKPDIGRPRLPIDRVFSIAGFGTIVTGTLSGGHLSVGDLVEIQPRGRQARIRGLQSHQTKLDRALPGSRVAVNLSGLNKSDIERGDVLAAPGVVSETVLCDVKYRHLPHNDSPLKHNMKVKFFTGASETIARTRVLKAKQIDAGESGWLQLDLENSVAMVRGDRFILRRPSPPQTLGGGVILDPHPGRKHRRFRTDVQQRLEMLEQASPEDLLLEAIYRRQPVKLAKLRAVVDLDQDQLDDAYSNLAESGQIDSLGDFLLPPGGLEKWRQKIESELDQYHQQFPLRKGISKEELRNRLGVSSEFFSSLVNWAQGEGILAQNGTTIRSYDHYVTFTQEQRAAIDQLLKTLNDSGINTPSVKQCKEAVGDDVYFALLNEGELVQISGDVVYTVAYYEQLVNEIREYLKQNKTVDVAKVRDMYGTSRKYAIALLEHLDDKKITRRIGDQRELL
ncbi:MAG: selenocysteine-specific translation elongation factor [Candidatus Promineifilaceae bacterium]